MQAPTYSQRDEIIDPKLLLLAYSQGVFPMADGREDPDIFWVEPRERAIIPLDEFRCSRSLAKTLKRGTYRVTCNRAFGRVVGECAAPRPAPDGSDEGSWISHRIERSYLALHRAGFAHSIECWRVPAAGEYAEAAGEANGAEPSLVGGLYGVSFDRVFCGESMFSRADNASKVALAWLVAAMRRGGYRVLDCQFMTDHLASLGAVALPQADYLVAIGEAAGPPEMDICEAIARFEECDQASSPGKLIAQSLTQTS